MTYGYQAGHRGGVLAEVKVGKVNRFEPFAPKRVAPVEKGAPVGPPAGAWRVQALVPAPAQLRGDAVKVLALLQAQHVRP